MVIVLSPPNIVAKLLVRRGYTRGAPMVFAHFGHAVALVSEMGCGRLYWHSEGRGFPHPKLVKPTKWVGCCV